MHLPSLTPKSNVIGQMFIDPNPAPGELADAIYRREGVSLTNQQIWDMAGIYKKQQRGAAVL